MFLRPLPILTALLLGAACSLLVACGGSDSSRLLPESRASELTEAVEDVREATADGRCNGVDPAITRARRVLARLSGEVDRNLRRNLREGVQQLEDQALTECSRTDTQTQTQTTDTTPTETTPPVETTAPPPTTTQTIPTTTTPVPTQETPAPEAPEEDDTGGITPGVGDDTGGATP